MNHLVSSDFQIHRVDALDCRIVGHDWAFERERAREIDDHWQKLTADRPAMFNGRVFLTCNWSIERKDGRAIMRSDHFETGFKSFLAWRDFGFPDPGVCNSFAAAALCGSDGGFLLGEMGSHTANAGQLYFPCGTPDRHDEVEGGLDLSGSVFRELAEETGIAPPLISAGRQWTILSNGPYLACLLDISSRYTARELARQASDFLAQEEKPELSSVYCVHGPADIRTDRMPGYIQAFFAARFRDAQQQQ